MNYRPEMSDIVIAAAKRSGIKWQSLMGSDERKSSLHFTTKRAAIVVACEFGYLPKYAASWFNKPRQFAYKAKFDIPKDTPLRRLSEQVANDVWTYNPMEAAK